MTTAVADSAVALAVCVVLLLAFVVVRRVVTGLARRSASRLRPALEAQVVAYLAETDEPPTVETAAQRRVLEQVALELLLELRGAERRRLAALLDEVGVVAMVCLRLASRSRSKRRRAADALAVFRSRRAAPELLVGLQDRDLSVRLACARGLAELDAADAIPAVAAVTLVAADTAELRPGAVAELLLSLAAHAPESLGALITTGPVELRRLAAAVAGELRIAQHAPLLRDAIASVDDELAARAARGSGLIGDIDAVPELLSVLRDESRPWFVRAAAAKAVGMIGDTRAVPALETELAGDAWWVQATAAEALAQLGVEGKHALERASASLRPDVRDHAVAALDQ